MPPRTLLPRLLLGACLLPAPAAFAQSSLDGAWQLQSGEYITADGTVVDYAKEKIRGTKVLGGGSFAFTTTKDGRFWAGGAGRYVSDDSRYVETPAMASYELVEGGAYTFSYTLAGDTWTLERHEGDRRVEREVWKRVGATP